MSDLANKIQKYFSIEICKLWLIACTILKFSAFKTVLFSFGTGEVNRFFTVRTASNKSIFPYFSKSKALL